MKSLRHIVKQLFSKQKRPLPVINFKTNKGVLGVTIYELIQELVKHPADAEIRVYDTESDEMEKAQITVTTIGWHGKDVAIKIEK